VDNVAERFQSRRPWRRPGTRTPDPEFLHPVHKARLCRAVMVDNNCRERLRERENAEKKLQREKGKKERGVIGKGKKQLRGKPLSPILGFAFFFGGARLGGPGKVLWVFGRRGN